MPNPNVTEAKEEKTKDSSQPQEQEIDLYIGIFFDGTNNNKYQTMLGKRFRREEILKELMEAANNGSLSDEQIIYLKNNNIMSEEGWGLWKKYIAIISGNQITDGRPRNFWRKFQRKNGMSGILTKSQLDQLYFGYENSTDQDSFFIEKHISKTLLSNTIDEEKETHYFEGKIISNIANTRKENDLLQSAGDGFIYGASRNLDASIKGAFAQNTTYTNVAVLESLYLLDDNNSETEKRYSIYIEGSGADMSILPTPNKEELNILQTISREISQAVSQAVSQVANEYAKKGVHVIVNNIEIQFPGYAIFDIFLKLFSGYSTEEIVNNIIEEYIMPRVQAKLADALNKALIKSFTKAFTRIKVLIRDIDDIKGLALGVGKTGVTAKCTNVASCVYGIIMKYSIDSNIKINLHFDLYGFSRGATSARIFNYAIDADRNNPKRDKGIISDSDFEMITGKKNFLKISKTIKSKEVMLLGIFDTVSSIGVLRNNGKLENKIAKYSKSKFPEYAVYGKSPYHDKNVDDFGLYATDQAQEVFHICALDEVRQNFALVDIQNSVDTKNGLELFIPGCHTDIGGGASIGREDEKIINHNSFKGVRNYFCEAKSTSYNEMIYIPISSNNLQKTGWLDNSQRTEDKTLSGRPTKDSLAISDETVYTDNVDNWHTRNNIIMNRYVKPGYSNIALSLMQKKGGSSKFKSIPLSYAVPYDLKDYYTTLEKTINQKGRLFANPSKASYYSLRNKYLHYSANDQLMAPADNLFVNPPAYALAYVNFKRIDDTIIGSNLKYVNRDLSITSNDVPINKNPIRLSSRIIYHGIKGNSHGSEVSYMFDYNNETGFDVQCKNLMANVRKKLQKKKKRIEEDIDKMAREAEAYGTQMEEKHNFRQSTVLFTMKMDRENKISHKEEELEDIINILKDFPKT